MTGGLDQAPITIRCPTARRDVAVRFGGAVGPQDHQAAVALLQRIGLDAGVRVHEQHVGVGHGGVFPLITTTDQHLATASTAQGVDVKTGERHIMGRGHHAPTAGRSAAAHVERATDVKRAHAHAREQHDVAFALAHRLRLHHAGVVDGVAQDIAGHLGAHDHQSTVGLQPATVADPSIGHATLHGHLDELIT